MAKAKTSIKKPKASKSKILTSEGAVKVDQAEQKVEESKYFISPTTAPAMQQAKEYDIPQSYGENKIALLVRDPRWVHSYWEITEEKYNEVRSILGDDFRSSRETLRVYDASSEPWRTFDLDVFGGAKNWYINVPSPGRTYFVDIGYLAPDGRFIMMARSNSVTTPREGMSDEIDEEWMTIDFEKMYALSGGFGIGKSSGEIKKLLQKHLMQQRTSGWVSSIGSPFGGKPAERPFFLIANTELIVYGATEPTAKLFVQGKRINLRRDGTFTMRFALPDGQQVIPIEAIRDDDQEKRSITPIVDKKTK